VGEVAERDKHGRFVKGASGNPVGRPVGVRNKTTVVKEFIENALVNELAEDAIEILEVAIKKAKSGDNAMIKLLLGDLLAEVRREAKQSDNGGVVVTVKNMTRNDAIVDATIIEDEDSNEPTE
jgi:hypothetical protein